MGAANSPQNTLRFMKGWKPDVYNPKQLVSCLGFAPDGFAQTLGNYWNGAASVAEPADSAGVCIFPDGTTVKDYTVHKRPPPAGSVGTMQAFYQTAVPPAPVTINKNCFITVNNIAATGWALGNTLNIVIDSPTTFKWQLNGGAFAGGLACSTVGTPIAGGNITVYFMTAVGFTIGDTWTWKRTDCSNDNPTTANHTLARALNYTIYKNDFFYVGNTGRITKVTADTLGVQYTISAGYRPIYGRDLESFYDHIIVVAQADTSAGTLTSKVVAWSDNIEINTFFATDTNEADTYTLPQSAALTPRRALAWKDTLFIFTSGKSYYTNYIGLPNVFSFGPFVDINVGGASAIGQQPLVGLYGGDQSLARGSPSGVYILSNNQIQLFNGASFTVISNELQGTEQPGGVKNVYAIPFDQIFYSASEAELYVLTKETFRRLFVYQEITGTWHEEYCVFGVYFPTFSTAPICFADVITDQLHVVLGVKGGVFTRLTAGEDAHTNTLVDNGNTYGKPILQTQILSGGIFGMVKEATGGYYIGTLPTGTRQVAIRWYVCDDGMTYNKIVASNPASLLTLVAKDGTLSFPRVSFRGLVLEVELSDTDPTKFPGFAYLTESDMNLIGLELEVTGTWPQQASGNEPVR